MRIVDFKYAVSYKVIGHTFLILMLLISFLNLMSVLVIYGYSQISRALNASYEDVRSKLPNYSDKDQAFKIFKEFASLKTTYIPFIEWRRLPYKGETTTIDRNNMRVHPGNGANLKSSKTVAFFGGSTMWGTGSADSGTIPAWFDYLSTKYSATNFGEAGYNSRQNLEMMINLINANEHIDTAVFYDGVNDVLVGCSANLSHNSHFGEWTMREKLAREAEPSIFWTLIEPVVRLADSFKRARSPGSEFQRVCDKEPQRAEAVADVMIKNWTHAHGIAERYGIRFYAVLQPVAYIGRPQTKHLHLDEGLGNQYRAVYPIVKRKIEKLAAGWMLDLTDSFDSSEYIYIDHCHVSENGNRIIAERIVKQLAN